MIALQTDISVLAHSVLVHTQVHGTDSSSPFLWYYPSWLPLLLIGLLITLVVLVLKYRTAYLLKKNEEMRLYRQTQFQGQMLAVINHDIQTPLHYLERSLEQIDRYIKREATDTVIRDTSDVAYHAVRQIRKFTGDLLIFVKMQMREHKEDIISEPVHVHDLVEVTVEFFSPTIQSKGLSVINAVPGDLILNTNKNLLSVILHNLIDNALKNTVAGEVKISYGQTADSVDILVTDTGSGMKQDTADWINADIDPGRREADVNSPDGSGIGLVIVKEFCAMLQIRLSVIPNTGRGTIARLSFPHNKR